MAQILIMISCYLGYAWVTDKFCKNYLEISTRGEILFVTFLIAGRVLVHFIGENYHVPYISFALSYHIFFTGLVLLLFQADVEKKILAAAMLVTAVTLVGNFCESFSACMALTWLHGIKNIPEPFLGEGENCVIVCIRFVVGILAVYWLSGHLKPVFDVRMRKWYVILAIPLFAVTTVTEVANWGAGNGILVRSGGNMGVYYDQIFSHTEICVLTALSMVASGFYIFGMNRIYVEWQKSGRYHSQVMAYKMLYEQYRQSERLRHDMKNHMIALGGLLKDRDWEKMDVYLRNMQDAGNLGMGEEVTGNRVIDALLYQKRKLAERKNILWECDVQMPKDCCIDEFDLCVLFGNVLDNALEACDRLQGGENRFINIQAKMIKKCFLLEVRNSAGAKDENQAGFWGKNNVHGHGIGLLNISDMVHGYNGAMDIEKGKGIFEISILLPLNDTTHNVKQTV